MAVVKYLKFIDNDTFYELLSYSKFNLFGRVTNTFIIILAIFRLALTGINLHVFLASALLAVSINQSIVSISHFTNIAFSARDENLTNQNHYKQD